MRCNERRRLGRSDVHVSVLGLGGAALGNLYEPVSEAAALATVGRALDVGITYFDTAPYYGYGLSEERLGRALAGVERDQFVLSTKAGRLLAPRSKAARTDQGFVEANAFDPVFDYSYDGVMRSFESSLQRLGVDRIDVLLMHDIGALTHGAEANRALFEVAMEDGYRAMRALRDARAVGAIGLGVNECAVCIDALARVELDCLLLAGRYTLLEQGALEELLPRCEQTGTSLIVGGPYNSGVLVEDPSGSLHHDYGQASGEIVERVEQLREACRERGLPLAAAALQFPLLHPAVASVIPGARDASEVDANAAWLGLDVPPALYRDLRDRGLLHSNAPIGDAA